MLLVYLVFVVSGFPPQILQVQSEVSEVLAGDSLILLCNASRQSTLPNSTTLEIFWLSSSNEILSTTSDIIIVGDTTTDLVIKSSLNFTQVKTSQAGTYTCVVNMTIPEVVVNHQVTETINLYVQSK